MISERQRLTDAMPRVIAALHGLARELDLTNDELLAILGFVGEVAMADELILLSDVLGVSRIVDDQTHALENGTASNVLGPFYRPGAPWISNPGSIARGANPIDGAHVVLSGRVTDAVTGDPLAGASVDVWQADARGVYSNEDSKLDPWNLRGRQASDDDGGYSIQTVQPLHYTVKNDGPVGEFLAATGRHPWRPAHIHLRVDALGYRTLVTQVYVAGGPYLDDDTIGGVKSVLIAEVVDGAMRFDVALDRVIADSPSPP